jgi:penicillin G amidase
VKKYALIAVVLLLVLAPLAFWWFCLRPVAPLDGREQIAGLDREVVVRFDAHAVPYIEARSEPDAYVAQGFITARDRMFQMDMSRRSANGTLSEVFGSIALAQDQLARTLRIRTLASIEFQRLSPAAKQAVDAYTRGVNAYLSQYAGRLGIEFTLLGYTPERWQPEDSMAILKNIGYRLDESWRLDDFRQRVANKLGEKQAAMLFRDDIASYGLPSPPVAPKEPAKQQSSIGTPVAWERVLEEAAQFGDRAHNFERIKTSWGSTAFAVPNNQTRTGGGMLACDKHGPLTVPAEWYLCSINAPSIHVAGATIPGVPGIWVGRNDDIGWGSASLKADVQDIFLEQFKSPFDINYKVGDKWVGAEVPEPEVIPVRLGKAVEHKVLITRHGPVLFRSGDAAISLAWTGSTTEKPTFEAMYSLNHARSWQEFTQALSKFADPPQMFVYADRWGNVGCQAAGLIPVRTDQKQGTMLSIGADVKHKWDSYIPFEKLPQAFVAATSVPGGNRTPLIAANQKPSTTNALPKAPASLILGHQWNAPYRANRLLATLTNAKAPIGPADINLLQGDEYMPVGATLAKSLDEAAKQANYIDRNGRTSIELLRSWDGQLKAGSVEASIYQAFLQTLMRRAIEPTLGRDMATEYLQRWGLWMPLAESIIRDRPADWIPPEERSYDAFFLTTLTQAMKSLKVTFAEPDPAKWNWGKIHTASFRHVSPNATPLFRAFAIGPVPVGGDSETLNSCDVRQDPRALFYNSESGPTQRMIVDMADRDKFYQALSTGQSGHRFSQYRADQLNAWQRVDLAPIAFSSDQLIRQTKHRLTLEDKYGR